VNKHHRGGREATSRESGWLWGLLLVAIIVAVFIMIAGLQPSAVAKTPVTTGSR
jgi:hypothetical protein